MHPRQLSTGVNAIFWVSQQYSQSVLFQGFPVTTWQVPAVYSRGPLGLETFDATTNALLDTEFDTSISGDVATFPGKQSPATFAVIAGQTYWWELVANKPTPAPLHITSASPPSGQTGTPYNGGGFATSATGGTPPYSWSWTADAGSSLPPGLSLQSLSGGEAIVGTPTVGGSYNVTVTVSDSGAPAQNAIAKYSITITGMVAEYPIPTAASVAEDITSGPDSNLWFTEIGSEKVGRLTTSGVFSEYIAGYHPEGITVGPDHNLWFFTSQAFKGSSIAKMTIAGIVSTFSLPHGSGSCGRYCTYSYATFAGGIGTGPDGNLWVTTNDYVTRRQCGDGCYTDHINSSQIEVRNTSGGIVHGYIIPPGNVSAGTGDVVSGPDGKLWFVESATNQIGNITTTGTITQYPVPTASSYPRSIAVGPDSNLWFTEIYANKIGKITTGGTITEYPVPTAASEPLGITAGPDGNVWFTERDANLIGRITPSGVITEYPIRTPGSHPWGITTGPDGNLWFVESAANKIAKFRP
jgi:streptogramin lyase